MSDGFRLAATIALAAGAAACFSSRTGPSETVAGQCRVPLTAAFPGSTVVVIRNFAFEPAEVRVRPGARITWVNCDGEGQPAHTVTADQGQFDSGSLTAGQAHSEGFAQAGRIDYHCEPHPFMKAAIVVE